MHYMYLPHLLFLPDDYTVQVAYPSESESELLEHLSEDYIKEVNCFLQQKVKILRMIKKVFSHLHAQGFLSKTGPSPKDVYKRRWCTLEGRKLMYHVDMLCAYAKVKITNMYVWGTLAVSCNFSLNISPFKQGEIFLGHTSSGFLVVHGFGPGFR